MASIINAATSGGLISTADTSGILQLQTAGTTAVTVNASQNVGIGTSSPLGTLGITGSATTTIVIPRSSNGTTGAPVETQLIGSTFTNGSYGAGIYALNAFGSTSANWLTFKTTDVGNGSPVERMRLDSSGNLGLGVTPSAFALTGLSALQIRNAGFLGYLNNAYVTANEFVDSAGASKYIASAAATRYAQSSGTHTWFTAASGTAGNAITFTQAMTLDTLSNLFVGWSPTGSGEAKFAIRPSSTYGMWVSTGFANSTPYGLEFGLQPGHGSYRSAIRGAPSNYGGDDNGMLLFYTSNSYNTGSLPERARITASGDFLVATTNTSSSAGVGLKVNTTGGVYTVGTVGDTYNFYNSTAGAYRFYVTSAGVVNATSTTISAISDIRLKENIRDLNVGLDAVMALKPRLYDWKEGKGADIKNARGFIAQEFEEVFPDLIDTWKDPAPEGEEPYKSVRQDLIPVLVKAIQEQQALIQSLKARLDAANL